MSFEMRRKVPGIKIKRPFKNATESALTFPATQHNSRILPQFQITHVLFHILERNLPMPRDHLIYCKMGRAGCIEQQVSIREWSYHYERWCTDTSGYDNTAPDWAMGGVWGDQPSWYRVVPPAGNKLLTEPPGEKRCGTMASGWLEGEHPEEEGETLEAVAHFDFDNNPKYKSVPARITNCGDYFVYFLEEAPAWDFGYCTVD